MVISKSRDDVKLQHKQAMQAKLRLMTDRITNDISNITKVYIGQTMEDLRTRNTGNIRAKTCFSQQ